MIRLAVMNILLTATIWSIGSQTSLAQTPWTFKVIAGVSQQTSSYYGGLSNVRGLIITQFDTINAKFNRPSVFANAIVFRVDSVYEFSGNPLSEISVSHSGFDYKIIYDGYPTQGGGWYGASTTVHHAWSVTYFGGPFSSTATDGVAHEFGHSRGAIDLYAIQVSSAKNHINQTSYSAPNSIMSYPYGNNSWDQHSINLINFNADSIPKTSVYITSAFPTKISINVHGHSNFPIPNADVDIYPIVWYSDSLTPTPVYQIKTNIYGEITFLNNPFQPNTNGYPWYIKYPNFLVKANYKGKLKFAWLPFTEVQNLHFSNPSLSYSLDIVIDSVNNIEPFVRKQAPDTTLITNFSHKYVAFLDSIFSDYDTPQLIYSSSSSNGSIIATISQDSLYATSTFGFKGQSQVFLTANDGQFSVLDTFNLVVIDTTRAILAAGVFKSDVITNYIKIYLNSNEPLNQASVKINQVSVSMQNYSQDYYYIDYTPSSTGTFTLQFTAIDQDGNVSVLEKVLVVAKSGNSWIAKIDDQTNIPNAFMLNQNYPNPFNPSTTIDFALPVYTDVRISIFNTLGQRVKLLLNQGSMAPGYYHLSWDGKNDNNMPVSSGIYFYTLDTRNYKQTKKMILIK